MVNETDTGEHLRLDKGTSKVYLFRSSFISLRFSFPLHIVFYLSRLCFLSFSSPARHHHYRLSSSLSLFARCLLSSPAKVTKYVFLYSYISLFSGSVSLFISSPISIFSDSLSLNFSSPILCLLTSSAKGMCF
ncbi:hypothetical protein Csa_012316 [Cucumis sativus]|nr:hypothetical protein Csa_012316 [Cucumis sativus]